MAAEEECSVELRIAGGRRPARCSSKGRLEQKENRAAVVIVVCSLNQPPSLVAWCCSRLKLFQHSRSVTLIPPLALLSRYGRGGGAAPLTLTRDLEQRLFRTCGGPTGM